MTALWMFLAALIAGGVCGFSGYLIGLKLGHGDGRDYERARQHWARLRDAQETRAAADKPIDLRPSLTGPALARQAPPVIAAEGSTQVPMDPQPAPEPSRDTGMFAALTDSGELEAIKAWGDEQEAVIEELAAERGES